MGHEIPDKDEIEEALREGVADGLVDEEEGRFKLTEQGEAHALELLGGREVMNAAYGFAQLLAQRGTIIQDEGEGLEELGREVNGFAGTMLLQRIMFIVHHYCGESAGYRRMVEQLEDHYLAPTGFFARGQNRAYQELPK